METMRSSTQIFLLVSVAVIATLLFAPPADAGSAREENCVTQISERTAAMVAEDWFHLERLAERYTKTCKGVFGAPDDSIALEEVAVSNIELGNPKKSLAAADSCIAIFYANTGCHLQRVVALLRLGRIQEASSSLKRTDRLIGHAIEGFRRDVNRSRNAADKELSEANLNKVQAQQEHSAAIRKRNFPE